MEPGWFLWSVYLSFKVLKINIQAKKNKSCEIENAQLSCFIDTLVKHTNSKSLIFLFQYWNRLYNNQHKNIKTPIYLNLISLYNGVVWLFGCYIVCFFLAYSQLNLRFIFCVFCVAFPNFQVSPAYCCQILLVLIKELFVVQEKSTLAEILVIVSELP